jgi:murein L,D-transpeptidase YcbB/YkuD
VAIGALLLAAAAGCKKTQSRSANGEVSRNWMPAQQDAYMGVPAADVKNALTQRLATKPDPKISDDVWKHVKKLYGSFNQTLLWLDDKGVHQPRVSALLQTLATADSDALRLDAYPLTALGQALSAVDNKHPTADQLATADVLLSSAFVTYGENMLTGQEQPSDLGQAWHINPQEEKVDSALTLSLREDDFAAGLTRMRPQDPVYDSLRVELQHYRQLAANGGWSTVPDGRALKRGDSDSPARIQALRARLAAEGYLSDSSSAVATTPAADTTAPATTRKKAAPVRTGPGVYDRTLAGAVANFQAHHGIVVDSMLGAETVTAMNVPVQYRVAQIAANLERYRWLPRSLGQRYILVNVPAFHLTAFDSGQKALEMKVIVGQEYEDKATPVFSDSMEYVIFRPYWNVTPDIAAKEIFPKGPDYIAANDMEVYNDHGRQAVRQRPGPKNALGFVKFMFPNDYNIYLHDTPNHELFNKDVRAFSHGCIRLEKPAELAQWVLGWPADKVDAAMHGQDNHQVNLPHKIPVYIVYFTTYVADGQLYFGNDLYDRDSKLISEVENAAIESPDIQQARKALLDLAKS